MLYASCPTCNTLLADKQLLYEEGNEKIINDLKLTKEEKNLARRKLLTDIGLIRMCCKMRMMSYTPLEKVLTRTK